MEGKIANIDTVKVTAEVNGVQRVEKIVNDYNVLDNKPQINNVELTGNKTLDELNIQPKGEYVVDSNYVHTDNNYSDDDKTKLDGLSNYTLPKASDSVLGGIKIGDNLNIDEEGKVSVIVTDGEDGATFTPSVDDSGNLSWTNDKSLPNPEPVNIKGPKGDTGEQGERGEQGLPGATGPGVPAGGTTGQVLSKTGDGDYETAWKDATGGTSLNNFKELTATAEAKINFDDITEPGVYFLNNIKGNSSNSPDRNMKNCVLIVQGDINKDSTIGGGEPKLQQIVFSRGGGSYSGGNPSQYGVYIRCMVNSDTTSYGIWYSYTIFRYDKINDLFKDLKSNHGNDTMYTSNVIDTFISSYIVSDRSTIKQNALNDLQTTDKSSLVGAINELVSRIEALEGTGE